MATNGLTIKGNNITDATGKAVGHIYGGRYWHRGQPCGGYGVALTSGTDTGRVFAYKADAVKYVASIVL